MGSVLDNNSTRTIHFKSGYNYQLSETAVFYTDITPKVLAATEFITLTVEGRLQILRNYCWDGASGPAIDRGVTGLLADTMRATLVHDALYQLMRLRLLGPEWRTDADILLDTLLEQDHMWAPRRWWWLRSVQWAGGGAIDPDNARQIQEAP
jgi:hypothetical protein